MTEQEYIETANLRSLRIAVQVLRDITTPDHALDNRDLVQAMEALYRMEERAYARVEKLLRPE